MSYRYMRILVFYDLPVETYAEQKEYRRFQKSLIKNGYIMMQESVYCKLALNNSIVKSEKQKLYKNKPHSGIVQVLVVTEKQFAQIEYIAGKKSNVKEDRDDRLIVL